MLIAIFIIGGMLVWGQFSIKELPLFKAGNGLRLMSMNITAGNKLSTDDQEAMLQSEPDIIVLVEWTGDNLDLSKFEKAGYSQIINHPRKVVHGLCILSKLEGRATIIESPVETPCALPIGQFRFEFEDRFYCLFAIHAPPPVLSCQGTNASYLQEIATWLSEGRLNQDKDIGMRNDLVLLAGDFNTLPKTASIDAFKAAGFSDYFHPYNLSKATWKPMNSIPYLARIDYILFPDELLCKEQFRFEIKKSDHLGLIADFALKMD